MKSSTKRLLPLALTGVALFASACGNSDSPSASSGMSGMQHAGQSPAATDQAFVAQMIPHHQMAVQMARDAQAAGQHPQIKSLAASIIQTQTKEIGELQSVAKTLKVKPAAMPMGGMSDHDSAMMTDAKTLGLAMDQMGMSMDMDALKTATPFDRAFIDDMVPHHQGAIRMARAELAHGTNPQLKQIATAIINGQTKEINAMNSWRTKWFGKPSPRRRRAGNVIHGGGRRREPPAARCLATRPRTRRSADSFAYSLVRCL